MTATRLDLPGYDTWLARALLERGLVAQDELVELLQEVRAARHTGATLARALRARELVGEEELEQLLAGIEVAETIAPAGGPPEAAPHGRLAGHRLIRRLGAGGMGVVYLGVDEATGVERAVKVLPVGGDPEAAIRFQREGEAMARVEHPNVVRVHSLGRSERCLFLVMDLAAGGSLADRLRQGPLEVEEARRLLRDLAQGLAAVHRAGVLHRDLKPDNVLFDERGTPMLTDFGLARLAWAGSLTESGSVMGTPSYMPPEQVEGQSGIDERADVYGLGAILYHVLTGRPPFQARGVMSLLAKVMEEAPLAPRELRPEVPPELDALCVQALAKDPAARPPSAEAFAAALDLAPAVRSRILGLGLAGLGLAVLAVVVATLAAGRGRAPTPSSTPRSLPTAPARVGVAPTPSSTRSQPSSVPPWPRADWNASGWYGAAEHEERARLGALQKRSAKRAFPGLWRLAEQGQPECRRTVAIARITGMGAPENIGWGRQLLVRALEGGDPEAAVHLAGLYLDPRWLRSHPSFLLDTMGHGARGARLGIAGRRWDLIGALARIGATSEVNLTRRAAQELLELLPSKHRPSSHLDVCWGLVQEAFEPPEVAEEAHAYLVRLDQAIGAWRARERSIDQFARRLEEASPDTRLQEVAEATDHQRWRAVIAYREGMKTGSDKAWEGLAWLAVSGGLARLRLNPPPRLAYRWLFLLAERRHPKAARVLSRRLAGISTKGSELALHVRPDPQLAGAWLRLWAAHDHTPPVLYEATRRGTRCRGQAVPRLASPQKAWRTIRARAVVFED